jgi:hypothetical protein
LISKGWCEIRRGLDSHKGRRSACSTSDRMRRIES